METANEPTWEDLVIRPEERAKAAVAVPLPAPVAQDSGAAALPAPAPVPQQQAISPSYLTHELRAPVTAIRLGLEILQEQVQDRLHADEKQMLDVAVKNTARL